MRYFPSHTVSLHYMLLMLVYPNYLLTDFFTVFLIRIYTLGIEMLQQPACCSYQILALKKRSNVKDFLSQIFPIKFLIFLSKVCDNHHWTRSRLGWSPLRPDPVWQVNVCSSSISSEVLFLPCAVSMDFPFQQLFCQLLNILYSAHRVCNRSLEKTRKPKTL